MWEPKFFGQFIVGPMFLRGVDMESALEELEKIYRCLCDKVIKNEDFSVLLLTLLTRYGKVLFPDELGTAEEIAFGKYLNAVK